MRSLTGLPGYHGKRWKLLVPAREGLVPALVQKLDTPAPLTESRDRAGTGNLGEARGLWAPSRGGNGQRASVSGQGGLPGGSADFAFSPPSPPPPLTLPFLFLFLLLFFFLLFIDRFPEQF